MERVQLRSQRLDTFDITNVSHVAERLVTAAAALGLDAAAWLKMCQEDARLLLASPEDLSLRIGSIAEALQIFVDEARELCSLSPQLLTLPLNSRLRSLRGLAALFRGRGLSLMQMCRQCPSLIMQDALALRAKMDALPATLGISPKDARSIIIECPELLRRSPALVSARFTAIETLLGIPKNYLAELMVQEPKVLCYSSIALKLKFDALVRRVGGFPKDVVDMVLVDPQVLLRSVPPMLQAPSAKEWAVLQAATAAAVGSSSEAAAVAGAAAVLSGALVDRGAAGAAAAGGSSSSRQQQLTAPASAARRAAADMTMSPLDAIIRFSQTAAFSVADTLTLCTTNGELVWLEPQELLLRLDAVMGALALPATAARALAVAYPPLLTLPLDALRERVGAVASVLQLPDAAALATTLQRHPGLLALQPLQLTQRLDALNTTFAGAFRSGSSAQLRRLAARCPNLLLEGSEGAAARLRELNALLGLSVPLVAELVAKLPALLDEPMPALQRRFDQLADRFGSFREDAAGVVVADPGVLLRDNSGGGAGGDRNKETPSAGDSFLQSLQSDAYSERVFRDEASGVPNKPDTQQQSARRRRRSERAAAEGAAAAATARSKSGLRQDATAVANADDEDGDSMFSRSQEYHDAAPNTQDRSSGDPRKQRRRRQQQQAVQPSGDEGEGGSWAYQP